MAEATRIDIGAFHELVAQYKAVFADTRSGELYKWRALKCFNDNWNIDAPDFAGMLRASLERTRNLLASNNHWPRAMIERFADAQPEKVREMFKALFDESSAALDVSTRATNFENSAKQLLSGNPKEKHTYQNPNSISTYLWLRYPDKYYIYKNSLAEKALEKLRFGDFPKNKYERMNFSFKLYDAIRNELRKDAELVRLAKSSLSDDCDRDESLNTLTIDFCYCTAPKAVSASAPNEYNKNQDDRIMDKNIILHGPPGTGKTYALAWYAVAIIEEKPLEEIRRWDENDVLAKYRKYKEEGLVEFTTFHQSYGYEEFIEGIRPDLVSGENDDSGGDVTYRIVPGIFKQFCDHAQLPLTGELGTDPIIGKNPAIWKVSLEGTGDNPTRKDCMENNRIRIGWSGYGVEITENTDYTQSGGKNVLNAFYSKMKKGDIVLSCFSNRTIDAIGVITGDVEWMNGAEYEAYPRMRPVKWLAKGLNEDVVERNGGKTLTLSTVYQLSIPLSEVLAIINSANPAAFGDTRSVRNHVFIIDEINRGNISKIFGELITLIEPSKRLGRPEGMSAMLPYSRTKFGVPDNVYILATMNTADRSIALLDTALRRRFDFVEMQPDPALLHDVTVDDEINVDEMLAVMNRRIEVLLDREHVIGHSYFLPLREDPTIETLSNIFRNKVFPLLQEYFHDDYEKIRLVLGDNQKGDDNDRFIVKKEETQYLFGNSEFNFSESYLVNKDAFDRIEAYASLS